MENLIRLVRNMHTGEVKLLHHFFSMQKKSDKKRDLLFDSVVRSIDSTDFAGIEKKIVTKLYPGDKNPHRAFEKLKSRLRWDILNILLLQESSIHSSKSEALTFNCRRYILQSEILLKRGLYKEAIVIMDKAICIAQKHELFIEQILIDNICSDYNLNKLKKDEYSNYRSRIKKASTHIEKLAFAKQFYDELVSYALFKLGEDPPYEDWKVKLDVLSNYSSSSDSVRIRFYFSICQVYYYRHTKQYSKSLESALTLLKQEETSEVFGSNLFKGTIHLETAKCFLLIKEYSEAIYHSSYSISHFGMDKKNALSSYEVLFYSFINEENFEDALRVTEQAFENTYLQRNNFLSSKWWFLKAGVQFKMKNYPASIISLKKCSALYKDKDYWMLACSLFETICRIENGDLDWFEYRSEGLKKIMMRHNKGKKSPHNNRFGLIYQILKTLNKNNFDFSRTVAEEKHNMELLSEDSENFLWNQAGCEIVRFDEWIKQKALNFPKNKTQQLVA
jgi:tetratricopeptide (TPR) repeat protein